jgi:hypothetical protein
MANNAQLMEKSLVDTDPEVKEIMVSSTVNSSYADIL